MLEKIEARITKEIERIIAKDELSKDDFEILTREFYRLKPISYDFCCASSPSGLEV